MSQYFATFPAGTFELIAKHLKTFRIEELKIAERDDSSVVFVSTLHIERLVELRYFTNVYLVVDNLKTLPKDVAKGGYFRLMLLKNGSPHQLDVSERNKLEANISHDFGLEANTHLSRNDFYLIERSSGKRLLTLRLPRAKFKREKLPAGELHPELAHILCLAAGVKAKHLVADVFAGYGSIPFEAVRGFGCKEVIAVDNQKLPHRHAHNSIKWHEGDARKLDFLSDNCIDRVVTDPPWGIYDSKVDNLTTLYTDFIDEVQRVLKPDGVVVVLSGFDKAEQCFEQAKKMKPIGKWNVLVSGKKAAIYKLQKRLKMDNVGLARGAVRLEPYSPEWSKIYQKETDSLKDKLGGQAKDIQHVGSTAIPNLTAKPIIDIAILVDDLDVAEQWVKPLSELGYWYKGKQSDMPDRRFFAKGAEDNRTVYLHLVNQAEFSRLIKFRDKLSSDPALAVKYSELKQSLAQSHAANREAYSKAKNDFIQNVLNS